MWPHLPQLLIATTSTNLTKLLISLSPIKTFDNLYQGDKKLLSEVEIIFLYPLNKSSNVLITYNEIIGFAKLQTVSCDDFLPRTHAHSHTRFSAARTSHARVRFAKIRIAHAHARL